MGLCSSRDGGGVTQSVVQNKMIEQNIRDDKNKSLQRIKLLFLGTGDSGKTTVFKQMRLLYGEGYRDEDRRKVAPAVVGNLIQGTVAVLKACEEFNYPLKDPAAVDAAQVAYAAEPLGEKHLSAELANAISTLWNDKQFQKTWAHRSNIQVLEGYGEFASRCCDYPTWGGPDWVPNLRETLLARVRTSGIVEECFMIKQVPFQVIDVGGQRNERRKWIHSFEEVTAVIFVVAASEYDQKLFEDKTKNRLEEAFELFEDMVNSRWFHDTSIILFLNKVDLFEEKYHERGIPINQSGLFPDAPTDGDVNKGLEWMEKRFINLDKSKKRDIFTHSTCALDTDYMATVLNAVREVVLKKNLVGAGLIEPGDTFNR